MPMAPFSWMWGDPADHLDRIREMRTRLEKAEKERKARELIKKRRKIRSLLKKAKARQLRGQP